jgi:hypothetical protein
METQIDALMAAHLAGLEDETRLSTQHGLIHRGEPVLPSAVPGYLACLGIVATDEEGVAVLAAGRRLAAASAFAEIFPEVENLYGAYEAAPDDGTAANVVSFAMNLCDLLRRAEKAAR